MSAEFQELDAHMSSVTSVATKFGDRLQASMSLPAHGLIPDICIYIYVINAAHPRISTA